MNRFYDINISPTLRTIYSVIRGEKAVSDAIFENVILRELFLTVIHENEVKLLERD